LIPYLSAPREREEVETIDEATDGAAFADGASAGGNESDDDDSVGIIPIDDTLEGAEDSIDTHQPLITTDRTGEIIASTTEMCRVILSVKTPEGQALFCENSADTCTQRTHCKKQSAEARRAPPGI
jgi:hypothetical protein